MSKKSPRVYSELSSTRLTTQMPTSWNLGKNSWELANACVISIWETLQMTRNKMNVSYKMQHDICRRSDAGFPWKSQSTAYSIEHATQYEFSSGKVAAADANWVKCCVWVHHKTTTIRQFHHDIPFLITLYGPHCSGKSCSIASKMTDVRALNGYTYA